MLRVKILFILMLLAFPAIAGDDEVIEMIDFLESYELLDDENFENLISEDTSGMAKDNNDE